MTQKGEHTWDLIVHYHACPACNYINESRQDYRYQLGRWIKDVTCDRCQKKFRVDKNRRPTFGPLIGTPQPPEFDWE